MRGQGVTPEVLFASHRARNRGRKIKFKERQCGFLEVEESWGGGLSNQRNGWHLAMRRPLRVLKAECTGESGEYTTSWYCFLQPMGTNFLLFHPLRQDIEYPKYPTAMPSTPISALFLEFFPLWIMSIGFKLMCLPLPILRFWF